jgi:Lrp/AsnC family transcriptional regulator
MDDADRKILALLQEDLSLPVAEIADRVGLSPTPCWRRIQRLEESGVIRKRVALLDGDKLNVGVTVFVAVRTNEHSAEWLDQFARAVSEFPEVVEFYRMSGDIDYLIRLVVPDIAAYDAFYRRLIAKVRLSDVSSSFAMEEIKYTTALPLGYIRSDHAATMRDRRLPASRQRGKRATRTVP